MRAVLLASCLSACSWVAVTPPADPPKPAGDCSTSFVAPSLDLLGTVAAGAFAVLGAYFVYAADHGCTHDCGAVAGAGVIVFVPAAVLTVTYGFSTGYGHGNVSRCRRLHVLEERQAARRTGED